MDGSAASLRQALEVTLNAASAIATVLALSFELAPSSSITTVEQEPEPCTLAGVTVEQDAEPCTLSGVTVEQDAEPCSESWSVVRLLVVDDVCS